MDLVKLVTTLVEGVVVNKEDVSIKEFHPMIHLLLKY